YPETTNLNEPIINLSVTKDGRYKWITEFNEYSMENVSSILGELATQENLSLLPKESFKTKIFLHADKQAEWNSVVQLIYALKKKGYHVSPVYEKNSD
ncbi:MAG: hypothetical protein JSS09_03080, partial [Verrucomicrobia bacterium]|nr:hypothetical protein [Verrucomicrobiota bacterium]